MMKTLAGNVSISSGWRLIEFQQREQLNAVEAILVDSGVLQCVAMANTLTAATQAQPCDKLIRSLTEVP